MDLNNTLQAGAILPLSAPGLGASADRLFAQAFSHPGCAGRRFVRLIEGELLGAGRTEMGVRGFQPASQAAAVGYSKKQALGFPAWVLVHHPDKAHFALDIMRDVRKAQALIATKPGHAQEAFTQLAAELERKVPAFLPTFWEEVGRRFIEHENHKVAAICFGKARDAELSYGLEVDEERRGHAYLEFALAGAVSAKSFSAYAKMLADAFSPEEAFRRYLSLSVLSIRGGRAPSASLPKELRRLAKAAKIKPLQVDTEFIEQVLGTPAFQRSAESLWEAYLPAIRAWAQQGAGPRERVLRSFPSREAVGRRFTEAWLELLVQIGAVEHWRRADAAQAGAWIEALTLFMRDLTDDEGRLPASYRQIVEALAPVLIKAQVPVNLVSRRRAWGGTIYSVELLEWALGLGLSLAPPEADMSLEFEGSYAEDVERLSQHEGFKEALRAEVDDVLGKARFEEGVRGKPAYARLRYGLLAQYIDALSAGGLESLRWALRKLTRKSTPEAFAEFPDLRTRLEAVQVAPPLREALRAGLLDELTWPAFEAQLAEFQREGHATVSMAGSVHFPILSAANQAVVFQGAEPLRRYDLPPQIRSVYDLSYLSADHDRPLAGDLCVCGRTEDWSTLQLWMSRPQEEVKSYPHGASIVEDFSLPDGRTWYGVQAVRVGEPLQYRDNENIAWDGESYYSLVWQRTDSLLSQEWDPHTLRAGRPAWPVQLRALSEAQDGQHFHQITLRPAPKGAEASPLGFKDGLVGGWGRSAWPTDASQIAAHRQVEYTRVDGLSFRGRAPQDALFIQMPGATKLTPVQVSSASSMRQSNRFLFLSEQGGELLAFGSQGLDALGPYGLYPRAQWLHFMKPRDLRVSEALRALDEAAVERFLAAAAEDRPESVRGDAEDGEDDDDFDDEDDDDGAAANDELTASQRWPQTFAAVQTHFGGGDEILLGAIAQAVIFAREQALGLAALVRSSTQVVEAEEYFVSDDRINLHFPQSLGWGYGESSLARALPQIAAVLWGEREASVVKLASWFIRWETRLDVLLRSMAFLMVRAHHPPEGREAYRAFLESYRANCGALFGETLWAGELKMSSSSGLFASSAEDGARLFRTLADGRTAMIQIEDTEDDADDPQEVLYTITLVVADRGLGAPTLPKVAAGSLTAYTLADDRGFYEDLLRIYAERGPVAFDLQVQGPWLAQLSQDCALSEAALRWLWVGLPGFNQWGRDPLGKELRAALDVKAKAIEQAKDQLRGLGEEKLLALLGDLTRVERAEDLWGEGGQAHFAARVKAIWPKRVIRVPEELVERCRADLQIQYGVRGWLEWILDFPEQGVGEETVRWPLNKAWPQYQVLDDQFWRSLAQLLPYLANTLPVGDALLKPLPAIYAYLRAQVQPEALVGLGAIYEYGEEEREARFQRFGGTELRTEPSEGEAERVRDNGTLVLKMGRYALHSYVRVQEALAQEQPLSLRRAWSDEDELQAGLCALLYWMSGEAQALIERIERSPVAVGQLEADPRLSAPETVAQVQAKHGISEEAAALYLLTLVHPRPTKSAVYELLGWKLAAYKKACDELVRAELFLEAKRAKAGRAHFLPGPWDAKRGPMEVWKLANLELAYGTPQLVLPWYLAYERAWARIEAGDAPGFEAAVRDEG